MTIKEGFKVLKDIFATNKRMKKLLKAGNILLEEGRYVLNQNNTDDANKILEMSTDIHNYIEKVDSDYKNRMKECGVKWILMKLKLMNW